MRELRRQFLKQLSFGSGSALMISSPAPAQQPMPTSVGAPVFEERFIQVRNRRSLPLDRLAAERVSVSGKGHYKPSLIRLSGEELLIVCYDPDVHGSVYNPPAFQYRSRDGGRSWSLPERLEIDDSRHGGGEPYVCRTDRGALLMTEGSWG